MSGVQPGKPTWSADIDEYPTALDCSTDGSLVAVGSAGGELLLFGTANGELRARWQAHDGPVQCLAWNPRVLQLASGGQDGRLRLWQAEKASLMTDMPSGGAWIERVAFNPQGSLVASAAGKALTVLTSEGEMLGACTEHRSTITGIAWRPNGEQLVTSCYGGIQILSAPVAHIKRRLRWQGAMLSLALSPDGRIVACGCQDNTVHFWRLANGHNAMMAGYPSKPAALTWSADGRSLATSGAASVTIWSFAGKGPEGTQPLVLQGHEQVLTALAFAPRGAVLASGCRGGRLTLWGPGRVKGSLWTHAFSAAVALLCWSTSSDSTTLVSTDEAGRLNAWRL